MNGTWRYALAYALTAMALSFATGHVVASPDNPQVLHAFCHPTRGCTDEQNTFGSDPQGVVAGPDGAYYGMTALSNTITCNGGNVSAGGSIYRADPVTRKLNVLYQFPEDYYPAAWLKADSDGYLYGGYIYSPCTNDQRSEGLFRLSSEGEFTIIHDETKYIGFVCNAPVRDSLGNWIGITSNALLLNKGPDFIYKITPNGEFKILHTLPVRPVRQIFGCPHYAPVLAADGNLYGIIFGGATGSTGALYRLAPDETFTILHQFDDLTEGQPQTPLTIGPEGALYGVLMQWRDNYVNTLYGMSLDGRFTNLGTFGPEKFKITQKLTLMPDGYFYGSALDYADVDTGILFRLSPAGEYTLLDGNFVFNSSVMIRGFDNALYGTDESGGKYMGGLLFRYVPPPVQ